MKKDTRTRILSAARQVFSQAGWQGATTQEIARVAKVNEVTIFRHFGSKDLLVTAVVAEFVEHHRALVSQAVDEKAGLESVLTCFAESYHECLLNSANFIRATLGEYSRHPQHVRKVLQGAAKPFRDQFLHFLKERQREGEIRFGINCETVLDLFIGMLFSHAVKPRLTRLSYGPEEYRRLSVELFVRGLRP